MTKRTASMLQRRLSAGPRGFTLVEVMVTLFILAIGVLGISGLQLASVRSNQSAFLRSQATLAAYALADRVRTDPGAFAGLKLDTDSPAETGGFKAWAGELGLLSLAAPTDQPLAELDCTADNPCNTGHCAITIRWDDTRGETPDLAQDGRDLQALMFRLCARMPQ
jgi:type IV pilus assembly protein PilV